MFKFDFLLYRSDCSQYMKSCREDCGIWLLSRCNGESADMTQILDYVWTSWEDSLDVG